MFLYKDLCVKYSTALSNTCTILVMKINTRKLKGGLGAQGNTTLVKEVAVG